MPQSQIKAPYQTERQALGKRLSEFSPCTIPANPRPGVLYCLDLFAGAGGFSTALSRAARAHGFEVDHTLVNHWSVALDTARTNLGNVRVFNSAIQDLDPRDVIPGGHVDILLASPECVFFSSARGAKPINDQRRSTAAELLRFLEELSVDTLVLENVSELEGWGPLNAEGRPIKEQKGKFFKAFIKAIKRLGYSVEYRHIVAADFGDPTTRKRLFLIAQKQGVASFPMQTHSKDGKVAGTEKWVPARAIIDFTVKGLSIFDRAVPHVPKTLRRISIGFQEQVDRTPLAGAYVEAVERFKKVTEIYYSEIDNLPSKKKLGRALTKDERAHVKAVKAAMQQQHRVLVEETFASPVATLTWEDILLHQNVEPTLEGQKHLSMGTLNVVNPVVTKLYGTGTTSDVDEPLDTVTAGGINFGLAKPVPDTFLVTVNHGDTTEGGRHSSIDNPLHTVTTKGSQGVVSPKCNIALPDATILPQHTYNRDNVATPDAPLPTITTISRHGLVQPTASEPEPFIASYYGPKGERDRRPRSVDEPLATQPTANRFSLVQAETTVVDAGLDPVLVSQHYGFDNANPSLDDPVVTASTRGAGYIASPEAVIISRNNPRVGERRAHSLEDPMPTATGSGAGYLAEGTIVPVDAVIIPQQRGAGVEADSIDRPIRSLTTKNGTGVAMPTNEIAVPDGFVTPNFGERETQKPRTHSLDQPLPTTTSHGSGMLVQSDISTIEPGKPYIIVSGAIMMLDCLYRMLTPDELAKAMSFTTDEHEYKFKTKSTSARVKMVGNAVAVRTARALITHALRHRFAAVETIAA